MTTTATGIEDVLLRDGTVGRLRPVVPDDEAALLDLVHRLSVHTRYLRFFSAGERPAEWYIERVVAHSRLGAALVAERLGQIVAVASFAREESDPEVADVGLLVDDEHQALGLGSLLLEHLARVAWTQGVQHFHADVLGENTSMLHVFRQSGLPIRVTPQREILEIEVSVVPSPELSDAVLSRESTAERASLQPLLSPGSIAIVGSDRKGSVGARVHHALTHGGFTGALHLVHGEHTVTELAETPDLVVVAVPAGQVLDVVRDCGRAGVRALVVLSAGFAEVGADGRELQTELVRLARQHDMRLVGPNCLGVVNTDPAVQLNATFADAKPHQGGVALVSQSGAIGLAALRHAEALGTGLSVFVSTGNKADVSGNDILLALHDDPRTRVIALYLESFGNAPKFARVASFVGRTKPVVVLKSGRTAAGARAGASHTAAAATPDAAVDALLRKARTLRATSVPELFDLVSLLDVAPLPRGRRVAVIGNSGGPGVLAADTLAAEGLEVPPLSAATAASLGEFLPAAASTTNPVDLLATATPTQLRQATELLLADPEIDAVLAIYTPISRDEAEPFAAALVEAGAATDKPLLVSVPGVSSPPSALRDADGRALLPTYAYPEQAAHALAAVTRWALRAPSGAPTPIRPLIATGLAAGWTDPAQVNAVLRQAGLPVVPGVLVRDVAHARAATRGWVALKAWGPTLVHKSEVGGVRLRLATPDQVADAFREMSQHLGDQMEAALVQPMLDKANGHELVVGLVREPTVGPLVHVGAGGVLTDVLDDHAFLVPPVTLAEAREAVRGLRCAPYLQGGPSRPPLDVETVAEVLVGLSDIALGLPEVAELEINPLVVAEQGVTALDARMRIEPAEAVVPLPSRALRQA